MSEAKCELCGEPMPPGEERFRFHGYSGPCPVPVPILVSKEQYEGVRLLSERRTKDLQAENVRLREELEAVYEAWPEDRLSIATTGIPVEFSDGSWRYIIDETTYSQPYPTRREAIQAYVATRKEMKK